MVNLVSKGGGEGVKLHICGESEVIQLLLEWRGRSLKLWDCSSEKLRNVRYSFVISLNLTGPEDSTSSQRLEDHETIRQGSLDALYFFKTSTHYTTTSTGK